MLIEGACVRAIAEIEIFSRAIRRLSMSRSRLIRVDYIDVDASTDRLQELERRVGFGRHRRGDEFDCQLRRF